MTFGPSVGFTRNSTKQEPFELTQHPGSFGNVGLLLDRASGLDSCANGHLLEIDTEARVAFLIAGLAIVAVVDAEDAQVRRIEHRYRGERPDIHEQLAISASNEDFSVGSRECKS